MQLNGDKEIGERIKQLRISKGLTQKGLADLVMISSSSIARLEKGQTMVSVFTMIEIAKALGVSVSQILSDTSIFDDMELANVSAKLKEYPPEKRRAIIRCFEQMLELMEK